MRAAPNPFKRYSGGLLAAASLALAGCGSASDESASATQRKAPSKTAADADASNSNEVRMARFIIEKGLRDPFFPNSKKLPPGVQPEVKTAPPVNIAALLQQGFQGIMGAGSERLAVINNIILEPGKKAEIPLVINGVSRPVKVRCQAISSGGVTLEIEGQALPVTIAPGTPGR